MGVPIIMLPSPSPHSALQAALHAACQAAIQDGDVQGCLHNLEALQESPSPEDLKFLCACVGKALLECLPNREVDNFWGPCNLAWMAHTFLNSGSSFSFKEYGDLCAGVYLLMCRSVGQLHSGLNELADVYKHKSSHSGDLGTHEANQKVEFAKGVLPAVVPAAACILMRSKGPKPWYSEITTNPLLQDQLLSLRGLEPPCIDGFFLKLGYSLTCVPTQEKLNVIDKQSNQSFRLLVTGVSNLHQLQGLLIEKLCKDGVHLQRKEIDEAALTVLCDPNSPPEEEGVYLVQHFRIGQWFEFNSGMPIEGAALTDDSVFDDIAKLEGIRTVVLFEDTPKMVPARRSLVTRRARCSGRDGGIRSWREDVDLASRSCDLSCAAYRDAVREVVDRQSKANSIKDCLPEAFLEQAGFLGGEWYGAASPGRASSGPGRSSSGESYGRGEGYMNSEQLDEATQFFFPSGADVLDEPAWRPPPELAAAAASGAILDEPAWRPPPDLAAAAASRAAASGGVSMEQLVDAPAWVPGRGLAPSAP